jgi:pimeloyl-ACP methyl ester carboxylesterase
MPSTTDLFIAAAKTHSIQGYDFTEPSHHFVEANGLRFHYVDWGGSGVPILFLHGGNQTCRTWDMVCVQIRNKYRCYALDQRNHGDSDKTPTATITPFEQREDVHGVVTKLGLRDFVLVGMSMGGLNALAYAPKYPEGLRALVIVDVTPTIRQEGAREIASFTRPQEFNSIEEVLEQAVKFNPLRPREHLHYSLVHALKQRPDGKWVWKHQRPDAPQQPPTEAERDALISRYQPLWDEVSKIPCPTLVIHGGASKVIHREDGERLAKAVPKGEVVTIPGAGHTVQGDKPKEFVAELTRFLDRALK